MDSAAAERSRQRVVDVLRVRVQAERAQVVQSLQRVNEDKRSLIDGAFDIIAAMDGHPDAGGQHRRPSKPRDRPVPLLPLLPLPSSPDAVHIPPPDHTMEEKEVNGVAGEGDGETVEWFNVQADFHPDASSGGMREGWWAIRALITPGKDVSEVGSVSLSIVPALQSTAVSHPSHLACPFTSVSLHRAHSRLLLCASGWALSVGESLRCDTRAGFWPHRLPVHHCGCDLLDTFRAGAHRRLPSRPLPSTACRGSC